MVAETQFKYDVYLAHASADKPAVRELAERPSELRTLNIQRRTSNDSSIRCSVFDVGCSTFSVVTLERHTALFREPTNQQRRFIPLRLDDCAIKDALKQFAAIDWRKNDKGEYERLLSICQVATTNKLNDIEPESSRRISAGEAFKKRFENDPELRAAMERTRPKIEAMAKQLSQQLREYAEYFEVSFGEPAPQSIEDWVRLAARAGLDPNWIREGRWSPREVAPIIEGYLQRVREGNS